MPLRTDNYYHSVSLFIPPPFIFAAAVPSAQVAEPTTVKQEESSIGSGAKEETNNIKPKTDVEDTASVVPMESNEEAVLVSVEDVEEAPEETIPGEEPKKEDKPKKEEEDPYFQTERRKWLDTRTMEPKATESKGNKIGIVSYSSGPV